MVWEVNNVALLLVFTSPKTPVRSLGDIALWAWPLDSYGEEV
jgi:hypothetical protein